jgi:adenylyltransferase/sulfurtransferase
MELLPDELTRYQRQMMLDGWGEETQKKLKNATAFVAGAGGLGSPTSIFLAAAGIGTITICDYDVVALSNLNRQILHDHTTVNIEKAVSAERTLNRVNNRIRVEAVCKKITEDNVEELVGDSDVILDCLDNFPTRYLLAETAVKKNIPFIHGSVWGLEGRLTFIHVPETPCLKCLFPEAPPKETFPILGVTAGVIGSLQAAEAIKYLTGIGKNIKSKLLVWDGMRVFFKQFELSKDPDCPVCNEVTE